jgi:hypothetical protein
MTWFGGEFTDSIVLPQGDSDDRMILLQNDFAAELF